MAYELSKKDLFLISQGIDPFADGSAYVAPEDLSFSRNNPTDSIPPEVLMQIEEDPMAGDMSFESPEGALAREMNESEDSNLLNAIKSKMIRK